MRSSPGSALGIDIIELSASDLYYCPAERPISTTVRWLPCAYDAAGHRMLRRLSISQAFSRHPQLWASRAWRVLVLAIRTCDPCSVKASARFLSLGCVSPFRGPPRYDWSLGRRPAAWCRRALRHMDILSSLMPGRGAGRAPHFITLRRAKFGRDDSLEDAEHARNFSGANLQTRRE